MEFLILIFIFYMVWKKYGFKNKLRKEEVIRKNGFANVVKISEDSNSVYYTAIKRGDNYLISSINKVSTSMSDIDILAKKMKEKHYHKGALFCTALPPENIMNYAKINSVELLSALGISFETQIQFSDNTNSNDSSHKISNIVDEKIESDSPIKEPSKSFWKDFFKKPDRL